MPSSSEHQQKAERNRAFLESLKDSPATEWLAIAAFYTALHLVDRLCACENLHCDRHQDRLSWLNKHKKHRAIYTDFAVLYDASLVARYGTVNQFEKAFPGDAIKRICKHLASIERYVDGHFNPPAKHATGIASTIQAKQ